MRALLLGLVLAATLLVGCIDKGDTSRSTSGNVGVVLLDDGTQCAVFKAGYAGGIDCDW